MATQRGQALLELAIFGSLFLMVAAVMVNYGINADVNQRAVMRSFRTSFFNAGQVVQGGKHKTATHLLVQDTHIPNPTNPFGIGSMVPLSTSTGGFNRNFRMGGRPEKEEELPVLMVEVEGSTCPGSRLSLRDTPPPCKYLLAGFRNETILAKSLDRYHEVYGPTNVCDETWCCNGQGCGDAGCVPGREEERPDPNDPAGVVMVCPAEFKLKKVRVIDPCEGEIITYDTCARQARMIMDSMVCEDLCNKGKPFGVTRDCRSVCSEDAKMNRPWYAGNGFGMATREDLATHVPGGSHRWTFGALEWFFLLGLKQGLQPGYVKETTMENHLTKSENELAVSTTPSIRWTDRTTRKFQSRDYVSGSRKVNDITAVQEPVKRKPSDPDPTWTVNW